MKINRLHLCLVSVLLTSMVYSDVENPNVSRSYGYSAAPSNAPQYSGQPQRFISQPGSNPYGKSSNDIVTGNVGGGKHFRGVVPYGSSYYSGAYSNNSGTQSVNRFLRRSANPVIDDRNPGQLNSYYDPSRTVSRMQRPDGTSGLSAPRAVSQSQKQTYVMPNPSLYSVPMSNQRPLSTNNMTLEQILARQEELREQARETETDQEDLDQEKNFFDQPFLPELEKDIEETSTQDETSEKTKPEVQSLEDILTESAEYIAEHNAAALEEQSESEQSETGTDRMNPESKLVPKLDPEMLDAAEGRKVLGEHETFQSLAEEKFSNYMKAAQGFMEEGKFYRAADTYALANVWLPKDARGYLGQSFSLLAAGEYMSSAYYLSRAFELEPKSALAKYDLVAFVGDRDRFENRFIEMATWQERSGSGELAFLMAYLSYQDNKSTRAVSAIQKAKEAMPDNRAVTILKNIIDPEPVLK